MKQKTNNQIKKNLTDKQTCYLPTKHITNPHKYTTTSSHTFEITPYYPINQKFQSSKYSKYKTFGDPFDQKQDGNIRIVSQNINCLGIKAKNNSKQERLINWLIQNEIDIIGLQEVGIAFHLVPPHLKLKERIQDPRWNKIRICNSNNKHENINRFQYGGTAVATFNEAVHRVKATGHDFTGLGRWSWILF